MVFCGQVEWYCDDEVKMIKENFFIVADNYVHAVNKIVNHYGEDNVESLNIEAFAPDDQLTFSEERKNLFNKIKEELSEDIVW